MSRKSLKSDRIKACELAAQVMQGAGMDGAIGPRLMSVTVFFENYIAEGCGATDKYMRLLEPRQRKALRLVRGGAMTGDAK
jgi:hypothetical protein